MYRDIGIYHFIMNVDLYDIIMHSLSSEIALLSIAV